MPSEQLKILHEEVNRGRSSLSALIESFRTRAAVLVSASGILTVLQGTRAMTWATWFSAAMFLLAGVIGVAVLIPASSPEVDIKDVKESWLKESPRDLEVLLMTAKEWVLERDKVKAKWMSRGLIVGYPVLVLAWIFAFFGYVI